ncbi:MAG: LAGLIDADG family homing endonuclease [bacterium]
MSNNIENTFSAYLGSDFQQNLLWQLLIEPDFADKFIKKISVEYFDDYNLKKLFIIMKQYYDEYEQVPNLQNKTIDLAIKKYFVKYENKIEEEIINEIIKKIRSWNDLVYLKKVPNNSKVIQIETITFIKQQEYRKFGEYILQKVKSGDFRKAKVMGEIEEKLKYITDIGDDEDFGTELTENIQSALREEFRQPIPTGIVVLDNVTGGGLGKGEVGMILTPSGVGKAQPLTSKILTPSGWTLMGNIKIGDDVIGSDGKSQKVDGVYPQGFRDIYKVEFNDGTSTMCDLEHLWSVNSLNQRTANTTIKIDGKIKHVKIPDHSFKTMTTKDMLNDFKLKRKNRNDILNYKIPIISNPIEYNTKHDLLINPYLLGFLIGDGSLTGKSLRFTSIDDELINKIKLIIKNDFPELNVNRVSDTISYSISGRMGKSNRLMMLIKEYGLNVYSQLKKIPSEYLISSVDDRISLLQGLLDTDGYASKTGRIQFNTSSFELSKQVKELVLSLGGFCKIKEKKTSYKNKDGVIINCKNSFVLTISFVNENIKPFSLKRKQDRVIYRNKYKSNKYISNIRFSHKEEAQCIKVSNNNSLYVTDDFILTHNTTTLTKIANTGYELGKNVLQIIFEDTEDQIKRKHYAIWTEVKLSEIDQKRDFVAKKVEEKISDIHEGRLVIKKFSQENTTITDIRNWISRYEKKFGFKFDELVLDYLDCVESDLKIADKNEAELRVVKSFLALADDLNIPSWTALQSNRMGFNSEFLEVHQIGGSIKRFQKAHLFMSIAKTDEQQDNEMVNIKILKARFVKDGQTFKNSILNNDTMEIMFNDSKYGHRYSTAKKIGEKEMEDFDKKFEDKKETTNEIKLDDPDDDDDNEYLSDHLNKME